nr:hypothetical protein [Desulfobacteraceae bacterium]
AGPAYSPKSPTGIDTIDEAKKDLARLLDKGDFTIFYYDTGYHVTNADMKNDLEKRNPYIQEIYCDNENLLLWIKAKKITVTEDGIDFPIFPLWFEDLANADLVVQDYYGYRLGLPNKLHLRFDTDAGNLNKVADDLLFIKQNWNKYQAEQLSLFEARAAQYRALKVKPTVSEEQRKFLVQANAFSEQKEYARAVSLYQKAITVDPVAYPSAYFNMALLSAQEHRFLSAIGYMKRYLLLVPDAKDARSAQDKIYEWEAMSGK